MLPVEESVSLEHTDSCIWLGEQGGRGGLHSNSNFNLNCMLIQITKSHRLPTLGPNIPVEIIF